MFCKKELIKQTENDTYYTFIMTSFDEQVDPYLKITELYSERMKMEQLEDYKQ